jgi:hypothetical protein
VSWQRLSGGKTPREWYIGDAEDVLELVWLLFTGIVAGLRPR